MNRFSERYGYRRPKSILQIDEMDYDLRISIYNELYSWLDPAESEALCEEIWTCVWHLPKDGFSNFVKDIFYKELKHRICEGEWFEVYDLVEFIAEDIRDCDSEDQLLNEISRMECGYPFYCLEFPGFTRRINEVLEREASGYRLVDTAVVPITDEVELACIDDALGMEDRFAGARVHLEKALDHFRKSPEPDYANTVKEAVSAVESAAQVVIGSEKDTLGKALRQLKDRILIHPSLADGWVKLYGYASDEGGIRHASSDGNIKVDFALAKYMLVTCSAFVNYLASIDGVKQE